MTTFHSSGSFTEPIVVSDEEDAAAVEDELNRWTDSSSSSTRSPIYSPTLDVYSSYHTPLNSPPALPSSRVPSPPASVALPPPLFGQKRKWTDMRDSSNAFYSNVPSDHAGGSKKKKKKQRKEQHHQPQPVASSSTVVSGSTTQMPPRADVYPVKQEPPSERLPDFPTASPYGKWPYETYYYDGAYPSPLDAYSLPNPSHVSPDDEYRPTDSLWHPSERPSTLSALATPWYPQHQTHYPVPETTLSAQALPRPPSPSAEPPAIVAPAPSYLPTLNHTPDTSQPSIATEHAQSDLPPLLQSFDSSLSERLRQLEALSASLLALAAGTAPPVADPAPAPPSPPRHYRPEAPPLTHIPGPLPARTQPESLKRLIGVPEDKCNHGYFDLAAPHLEPPSPASPIPPVPEFTLVMAQLPKKYRKIDFVTSWAKRYGTPVRVVLDSKAGKALLEWVGAHSVESAFTSLRFRGSDGKEHIRVYKYRGDKPPPAPRAAELPKAQKQEVEEGEIEEGEVVETKSRRKKNKGKKKQLDLQDRLTEPAAAPSWPAHAETLAPVVVRDQGASSTASPIQLQHPIPPPTVRPSLIERFDDPPAVIATREEAGEEEMELESDDEEKRISPLSPVVASTSGNNVGYEEEDMDLEGEEEETGAAAEDADGEGDDDMDMEMSSSTEEISPSVSPESATIPTDDVPPATTLAQSEATIEAITQEVTDSIESTLLPASQEQEDVAVAAATAVKEARRHKLVEAIARTKAELAMREVATNTRTSLVSSAGTSESPEPMTPIDSPAFYHAEVATLSLPHSEKIIEPMSTKEGPANDTGPIQVKTEPPSDATLDDLAVSFISESIHSAGSSPPSSRMTPALSVNTVTTHVDRPSSTVSAPKPVPATQSTKPFLIPLTEEQKQSKQKRWLELASASKALFGKLAAAKTKEEKDLLMRLLKAKTKAADEVKQELDSGVMVMYVNNLAPASTVSVVPTSATPTPVPSSRMSSATPTPDSPSTATSMASQGRKTSPSVLPFRWPETAREMIIIVSDDESE